MECPMSAVVERPDTVTIVCECGHIGICTVPITVDNLWCSQCSRRIPAPDDFRKHDATFWEMLTQLEIQKRIVAKLENAR